MIKLTIEESKNVSEKNILLTYKLNGVSTFSWFETEEGMNKYISENSIKDIDDAIEVNNYRPINVRIG